MVKIDWYASEPRAPRHDLEQVVRQIIRAMHPSDSYGVLDTVRGYLNLALLNAGLPGEPHPSDLMRKAWAQRYRPDVSPGFDSLRYPEPINGVPE